MRAADSQSILNKSAIPNRTLSAVRNSNPSTLILSVGAFGCVGQPADIAAPSSGAVVPRQSVSAREGLVTCDVAVQTSTNTYRVRKASIDLPMTIRYSASSFVKFVFLAWGHDGKNPSRFAACQVPNSPQALAYFDAIFSRGTKPILQGSDQSIHVANSHARDRVGEARYVDADEGTCPSDGPIDYGCACSGSTCDGWATANTNSPDPSPSRLENQSPSRFDVKPGSGSFDPAGVRFKRGGTRCTLGGVGPICNTLPFDIVDGDPDATVSSSSEDYDPAVPTIWCVLQTQDAHFPSNTFGMISVHGTTNCTSDVASLRVYITLQIHTCVSWDISVCWWQTLAQGIAGPARGYSANAQAIVPCVLEGWYAATTQHDATWPPGYAPPFMSQRRLSDAGTTFTAGASSSE